MATATGWLSEVGNWALAALIGAISSLAAAYYYECATCPALEVVEDDNPPVVGHRKELAWPPHKFLQVKVRQKQGWWPFNTRRPAWATRATINVQHEDGTRAISGDIVARWSGSPEPLTTAALGHVVTQLWDISKLPQGQRFDIHANADQQAAIAVKFEGEEVCYVFSNESYIHNWKNPDWCLRRGTYLITFRVYYEVGTEERRFQLRNINTFLKDFTITAD